MPTGDAERTGVPARCAEALHRIDWNRLLTGAVDVLRQYLALDTTNPPGNETLGARFLADVLAREGVASEVWEPAPGRGNLVARLGGNRSRPGLVLHHHIDVVYAERAAWTVDPFGGVIADGYLYGRGALDMKSVGVAQLMTFLAIRRAGMPLSRDLVLLATADEEAGSRFGVNAILERRPEWLRGVGAALSESGGIFRVSGYRVPLALITVSEKTSLPLRVTARGTPGHGSQPGPDSAPHRLIASLARLLAAERPPRVLAEVQEYFSRLATVMDGGDAGGYRDVTRSLADPRFRARFFADLGHAAMVRTTFAANILEASRKRNVIPSEAWAEIDCRMLRGEDPDEIVVWVRSVVADAGVEVRAIQAAKEANVSPTDSELYHALARALRRIEPRAVVAPALYVAYTDNWSFRRAGLEAYGFTPFVLDEAEAMRIHGTDERIALDDFRGGLRAYAECIVELVHA